MPVCTRCQTTNTECRYVRSRRGLRSKHGRHASSHLLDDDISLFSTDLFSGWLNLNPGTLPSDLDIQAAQVLFQPLDVPTTLEIPPLAIPGDDALITLTEPEFTATATPGSIRSEMAYDPMIQLYYQNFHPSHPLLLPKKSLCSPLCQMIPPYIFAIMRYIGAHYYPEPAFKQTYRQQAYGVLSEQTSRDPFKVQALLLLAIIDHSHCHEESGHRLIQEAVNLALDIKMNRSWFAREHSHGYTVLEESWRRTYWELYVVDGLFAATREQNLFQLYHQRADVRLPCAEKMYHSCDSVSPTRQTLDDLLNDWTLEPTATGQSFSSFAYRINAVRNLGMALESTRSLELNLESQREIIDARLASSLMTLPPLQGEGYDSSSHDEMIFQAQMALYLALIYLHHPHSSIRFASFSTHPPCTRLKASRDTRAPNATEALAPNPNPNPNFDLHSHKLLRAADLLSSLATLPSSIQFRSPFFTCALAICVVVHTAAGLVASGPGKRESLKVRVQLGIGALNALGKVWPLARSVRQQMLDMYQEVQTAQR
ncbi:hypothetical protein ARAM_007608 [Aspergillus rambellii]|uniref:Xylanolytic transcriptional activator regulatory domain-containing protein n=1 Tax=Aspergillus rambellii TaxID=308745 RepID=A0A0F8XHE6_9EURO|nr:hypothetical protein ARAM_007608 [Aspergillus rambellii]